MNFPIWHATLNFCAIFGRNVLWIALMCFYKFTVVSDMYNCSYPATYDIPEHPVVRCRSPVRNNATPPVCLRWAVAAVNDANTFNFLLIFIYELSSLTSWVRALSTALFSRWRRHGVCSRLVHCVASTPRVRLDMPCTLTDISCVETYRALRNFISSIAPLSVVFLAFTSFS
jgi:hypothetical protein